MDVDRAMRFDAVEPIGAVGNTSLARVEATVAVTGERWTVGLVSRPDAVAVLPVDDDRQRVALARQGRVGAGGRPVLEVPAGIVDDGEDAVTSARRELEEELGLRAGKLELVADRLYASPGYSDERISLVVARDLEVTRARDEDAYIELLWLPMKDLFAMTFADLKTFALIAAWRHRQKT